MTSTAPIIVTKKRKTIATATEKKQVSSIGLKIVINVFFSNDHYTLFGQKFTRNIKH
jgi:hypothetical protein